MKKLLIIALVFCTLSIVAQGKDQERRNDLKERFTKRGMQSPEDRAKLETKQMTLRLDLSKQQQTQVEEVLFAHYSEGKKKMDTNKASRKDMSDDKRKQMKLDRLDAEIALKENMKSVLNESQYAKYSKMLENRGKRSKGRKMRKD